MLQFLRSRQWIVVRRLVLAGIIVILGIRQYGGEVAARLRRPNPTRDIVITRTEFRPELPGAKPAWIIGFRNNSDKFTYDRIQLEAKLRSRVGHSRDAPVAVASRGQAARTASAGAPRHR